MERYLPEKGHKPAPLWAVIQHWCPKKEEKSRKKRSFFQDNFNSKIKAPLLSFLFKNANNNQWFIKPYDESCLTSCCYGLFFCPTVGSEGNICAKTTLMQSSLVNTSDYCPDRRFNTSEELRWVENNETSGSKMDRKLYERAFSRWWWRRRVGR